MEFIVYVEAREQLTNNLQVTLLFGDDNLSEEQHSQIFKSVQLYIKQTNIILFHNKRPPDDKKGVVC
jgi:predicted metal-binding protein